MEKRAKKPLTPPVCFPSFPAQSLGRNNVQGRGPSGLSEKESRGSRCCVVSSGHVVSVRVAHVAQLVEHVLGKDEVIGSIPIMGSRLNRRRKRDRTANDDKEMKWNAMCGRQCSSGRASNG